MLETMTDDKRIILAEQICDLLVKYKADAEEAYAAMRIVHDLMQPSGLAIVRSKSEIERQALVFKKNMQEIDEQNAKMRDLVHGVFTKQKGKKS